MSDTILLRCPKCRRSKRVPRCDHDYPEAVAVEIQCDRCNPGDFDEPHYFDAAGKSIVRDPDGGTSDE